MHQNKIKTKLFEWKFFPHTLQYKFIILQIFFLKKSKRLKLSDQAIFADRMKF